MKKPLKGDLRVPGDKSISHRALLFAAMAEGTSVIENLSDCEDVGSTWRCLRELGVPIQRRLTMTTVRGLGWRGLHEPGGPLDCGNSGTTMRLLTGLLSGYDYPVKLIGDESLSRRPMGRVAEPLRRMGATVELSKQGTAPIVVRGMALAGIDYESPVASAQVKSAVLLAGLMATGKTSHTEPSLSRDHTERMLPVFGVTPRREGLKVTVDGTQRLAGVRATIPRDPSAAAFWTVGALLAPESELRLPGLCVNPTRVGFIEVLKRMGGRIRLEGAREEFGEPTADLVVATSPLKATDIVAAEVPSLIDEVPILALAASQAEGISRFRGLCELRVKESDRLSAVAGLLNDLGARAFVEGDDLLIRGPCRLKGGAVRAHGDHRIAMTALIAALIADDEVVPDDLSCIAVSYPDFLDEYKKFA